MSAAGHGAVGKPDALLLDEMFTPAIAASLSARGVDCRAVAADSLLRAQSDVEIFETALLEVRVVVTNNVADFESLRRARDAAAAAVPGLIYTSDAVFPRTRNYLTRLVAALEGAAASHAAGRHGGGSLAPSWPLNRPPAGCSGAVPRGQRHLHAAGACVTTTHRSCRPVRSASSALVGSRSAPVAAAGTRPATGA